MFVRKVKRRGRGLAQTRFMLNKIDKSEEYASDEAGLNTWLTKVPGTIKYILI